MPVQTRRLQALEPFAKGALLPLGPRLRFRRFSGRGGIGRRATLRSLWAKARGSSSLLDRTRQSCSEPDFRPRAACSREAAQFCGLWRLVHSDRGQETPEPGEMRAGFRPDSLSGVSSPTRRMGRWSDAQARMPKSSSCSDQSIGNSHSSRRRQVIVFGCTPLAIALTICGLSQLRRKSLWSCFRQRPTLLAS